MRVQNPTETKRHFSLKIGVVEDVDKEVVGRTTPMSNVTNVTSRGTMRRTVTPTVATTVEKWDILQKIVDSEERWKRQQILP